MTGSVSYVVMYCFLDCRMPSLSAWHVLFSRPISSTGVFLISRLFSFISISPECTFYEVEFSHMHKNRIIEMATALYLYLRWSRNYFNVFHSTCTWLSYLQKDTQVCFIPTPTRFLVFLVIHGCLKLQTTKYKQNVLNKIFILIKTERSKLVEV